MGNKLLNAVASVDAYLPAAARVLAGARPQLEPLARSHKELRDLVRPVRESIAQVFVWSSPVDEGAPVCSNQSPDERPRLMPDVLMLPALEHDLPLMLHAVTVLGKEAWQVGVVEREDGHRPTVCELASNRVLREASLKELMRTGDDPGVLRVEEQTKPQGPTHSNDVAIAQVEAEQLGVLARSELDSFRRLPAAVAPRTIVLVVRGVAHVSNS